MFKTLLFPIDLSKETSEITCKAIQLAKEHQSHITILSVFQPERGMNNHELTTADLNKTKEQIQESNITCDLLEREGKPAFIICDVAADLNVDLIMISTKGVNLENDSESTAARVIQLAPCPVLVVP